jgi:glycine cleavage system H lipoate-binding protein
MHHRNKTKNMKRSTIFLIIQLLWGFITPALADEKPQSADTIEIFSTPELSSLTRDLVNEYSRQFPGEVKIRINILPEKADGRMPAGKLSFVSGGYYQGSEDKSVWKVIIGRDVIVPVINEENPFLAEILQKGISPENIKQVFENKDSRNWGMLLKNGEGKPAHFYILNDEQSISAIQKFLNSDPLKAEFTKVNSGDEVIAAIQKDPYGIGFTRMTSIPGYQDQLISGNIRLMPIDKNNNGTIDYSENFYEDLIMFSRGVWIGKYPKSLYSNIYSVSEKQPGKIAETAFLKWILGEGQILLAGNGYSDLNKSERQSAIDRLYNSVNIPEEKSAGLSPFIIIALFLVSLGLLFYLAETVIRFFRAGKSTVSQSGVFPGRLNENSLLVPKGLFFDKTHTWAFMEQNGLVKIGVDDFLQHITGTITRIKLKNPGEKIKKGEYILSIIRNGKQLNLYSPVSGVIKEYNSNLNTDSSVINSSPYNLGWVYRLEPSNWLREIQLLLMSDKYAEWIRNEFARMKDFLALTLSSDKEQYSKVILQDGGELTDSTLADLGPEIWDDFQTKFIDISK